MGSQMIQIIILAAIALFLILRLRNVLGHPRGLREAARGAGQRRRAAATGRSR